MSWRENQVRLEKETYNDNVASKKESDDRASFVSLNVLVHGTDQEKTHDCDFENNEQSLEVMQDSVRGLVFGIKLFLSCCFGVELVVVI